jgi:hypothetical protein
MRSSRTEEELENLEKEIITSIKEIERKNTLMISQQKSLLFVIGVAINNLPSKEPFL